MSRPFSHYSAKPTFAQVNKSSDASEYISNKKTKYSFCSPNLCHPNKNVYSQSNLLLLKKANKLAFYPCNNFNRTQLYSNLYTQLDLTDISYNTPIISEFGVFPATKITTLDPPYLEYTIDPSGVLFGNSTCGINNYLNFVTFDPSLNVLI